MPKQSVIKKLSNRLYAMHLTILNFDLIYFAMEKLRRFFFFFEANAEVWILC